MKSASASLGVLGLCLTLAACGGGQRQDATEPHGDYQVDVGRAVFPPHQDLARETKLQLEIKNTDTSTLPDLAVTIWTGETKAGGDNGSFSVHLDDPSLANPNRPVWILEDGNPQVITPTTGKPVPTNSPTPYVAAQTDTFQFGPLAPGDSKEIVWNVTPVKVGTYTVHYEVSAGLEGNARAVTRDGGPVTGEFVSTIQGKPPRTCVKGNGQVTEGRCQLHG
jgi:hypothetical protein